MRREFAIVYRQMLAERHSQDLQNVAQDRSWIFSEREERHSLNKLKGVIQHFMSYVAALAYIYTTKMSAKQLKLGFVYNVNSKIVL